MRPSSRVLMGLMEPRAVVMVGRVPTILPSARSNGCRQVDPRDKPEDDRMTAIPPSLIVLATRNARHGAATRLRTVLLVLRAGQGLARSGFHQRGAITVLVLAVVLL